MRTMLDCPIKEENVTVKQLQEKFELQILCMPDPDKEVLGGYTGDLLSYVMNSAQSNDAWITIMNNLNVVAVASLTDVACVILAQGVIAGEDVIKRAEDRQVNLLASHYSAYELCAALSEHLK